MVPVISLIIPWGILWLGLWLEPAPPEPVYTYGEFPFELQYEMDGNIKTIKDVIICEYKGIEINEASGKYRKWESRILSNNSNRITLFQVSGSEEIYYNPGPPGFYMGDYNNEYNYDFPNARFIKYNEYNSGYQDGVISAEELYSKYKIKLLKWEVASPIQNSFKQTNKFF